MKFFDQISSLLLIFTCQSLLITECRSKEVVAKKGEWTLVEEGDSIPAGLHVRIDMSTGEKYVKLLDDEDGSREDSDQGAVVMLSSKNDVEEEACRANDMKYNDSHEKKNDMGVRQSNDAYDYVAMHRALSHLPLEEQERIGGIPEIPDGYYADSETSSSAFYEFRSRMKQIWEQRQSELKKAQLTDITKELMSHIGVLEKSLNVSQPQYEDFMKGEFSLNDSLDHLEYLLSDVDAARDFHTLGGWPLLSSLLLSDVVFTPNTTSNDHAQIYFEPHFDEDVRTAAAWVIGTAVKNMDEFREWATEAFNFDIWDHNDPTAILPSGNFNILSIILNIFRESQSSGKAKTFHSPKLTHKCIYAIGSLLRGNAGAQRSFVTLGGPVVLADTLTEVMSQSDWKLASKFVLLASDLIEENKLLFSTQSSDNIGSYSTTIWCDGATSMLQSPNQQLAEKSLLALRTLSPYCKKDELWSKSTLRSLEIYKTKWHDHQPNVNIDWYEEVAQLLEEVLLIIKR